MRFSCTNTNVKQASSVCSTARLRANVCFGKYTNDMIQERLKMKKLLALVLLFPSAAYADTLTVQSTSLSNGQTTINGDPASVIGETGAAGVYNGSVAGTGSALPSGSTTNFAI